MGSDENKIRSFEAIDKAKYENIDNDRLVLYAVDDLEKEGIEPTFDKVVVTAFKLFPARFSLIGFSEYPDGKRINDALLHCTYKSKKWISGNAKSGYKITEKGKYYLRETEKMLRGEVEIEREIESIPKRKELTFINYLKDSEAFDKYKNGNSSDISEKNVLDALRVSERNIGKIQKNWEKYLEYASRIDDEEAEEMLFYLREKMSYLFG